MEDNEYYIQIFWTIETDDKNDHTYATKEIEPSHCENNLEFVRSEDAESVYLSVKNLFDKKTQIEIERLLEKPVDALKYATNLVPQLLEIDPPVYPDQTLTRTQQSSRQAYDC